MPEQQQAQRDKWREDQAQRREEKRQAAYIPTADQWLDDFVDEFPTEYKESSVYQKQILKTVAEEMGRELDINSDEHVVMRVALTLIGLKKKDNPWVQEVRDPYGVMVSGLYFPDVLGSELVESVHRYALEKSATFAKLYRELLKLLDKRYGHERTEDSRAIKAELAGIYVYVPPAPPQPKPEPKPEPKIAEMIVEPVSPEVRPQIPNVNWSQLNRDLDEQARRFLEGIR